VSEQHMMSVASTKRAAVRTKCCSPVKDQRIRMTCQAQFNIVVHLMNVVVHLALRSVLLVIRK
jgi:hypothetical protein